MSFTPINRIIPRAVKKAGIKVKLDESKLLAGFDAAAVKLFGESVLRKVKPLYIQDKTLLLACLSDILAQQIKQREKHFLFELNKPFGGGVIEKIRFL